MTRRRHPSCRRPFFVPVPSDPFAGRSGREVIEEATSRFVAIGREIISAAVAAIVDAATTHGFAGPDWEADSLRPDIAGVIAERMHSTLVAFMTSEQPDEQEDQDQEEGQQNRVCQYDAARAAGLQGALVEQLFVIVQTECEHYGLYPAPGHVERLRECLRELVSGHWSDTPAHGPEPDVKSVLPSDRVCASRTLSFHCSDIGGVSAIENRS